MPRAPPSLLIPAHLAGPNAHSHVLAFLLGSLGVLTQHRYVNALIDLNADLEIEGVGWSRMSEEARDWFLAEYVLSGMEDAQPRARYSYLLAALSRIDPRAKYRVAWKVLEVFGSVVPCSMVCACEASLPNDCITLRIFSLSSNLEVWDGNSLLFCF